MSNLVHRRSAKSYYHAKNRLYQAYGEREIILDEARWAEGWDKRRPRDVRELLFSRLKPVDSGPALHKGDSNRLVKLPCGHKTMIRKMYMAALTNQSCATYSCPSCGERVLHCEDDKELMLRSERLRARGYPLASAQDWHQLDKSVGLDERVISVRAPSLLCALAAALGSLRAPAFISPAFISPAFISPAFISPAFISPAFISPAFISPAFISPAFISPAFISPAFISPAFISPVEISFLGLRETTLVFKEFAYFLKNETWLQEVSVSGTFAGLLDHAFDGIRHGSVGSKVNRKNLPPGWHDDLKRWLIRAVRLIADCGCTRLHAKHFGIHKHGDRIFCGVQDPEEVEAEDDDELGMEMELEEQVTSMADLEHLMKDSSLGTDPTGMDDLLALAKQEGVELAEDDVVE